jgi:hypothetical protein
VAEYLVDLCLFAIAHGKDNAALFFVQVPVYTPVTPGAICLFHLYPLFLLSIRAAFFHCSTQQLPVLWSWCPGYPDASRRQHSNPLIICLPVGDISIFSCHACRFLKNFQEKYGWFHTKGRNKSFNPCFPGIL